MFRNLWIGLVIVAVSGTLASAQQERRSRINVEHYVINA